MPVPAPLRIRSGELFPVTGLESTHKSGWLFYTFATALQPLFKWN
jgi:hypothetical protein